ncbi:MAG TPA: alpha-L-fucosidase [Phycisphaerae bacterium]|nr:alpha-L-fucosidase [Phycisphaerae bacterium]HRY68145.1 alpha-L-fucosidase [Phycisphaerae bacterium]HSA27041.1 alpha-L-fucosidase [Phycisphaerae bacterium]
MKKMSIVSAALLVMVGAGRLVGADAPPAATQEAMEYLRASPQDMQWWREARFGLFVHWGPVSLQGTEIGWSRGGERRGTGGKGEVPLEVYDNLYKKFNPVKFSAEEWVRIAQDAGMRYLVFTTKHHDGFTNFDSKLTDYKITSPESPFGRDIVAELARACHQAGMRLGFYYSPPDWHHPNYRTAEHAKYIEYLHGQLRELCSRYGRVDIIWFDGLGGTAKDWDSENLFKVIRTLQPHVLLNNRAGLPGDFGTPEQTIGRFDIKRPWESCITICQQWAWKPNDNLKSLKECVHTLVRCAGGDGNLLLNVGPMPSGEIEPRQVEVLRGIGQWLKAAGEAVYGTRGGPFMPGLWGASTHRGKKVYLHVLEWPDGEELLVLPAIPARIVASSLLGGGTVTVEQGEKGITVGVRAADRRDPDTIVVLELACPAIDVAPVATGGVSLTTGKKATASNVFQNSDAHGPDKAVDENDATRWATDAGTHSAWLEVDLGEAKTFDRATLREAYERVRAFELQYKDGDSWRTFATGTTIGRRCRLKFAPVTARHVRLNITEATEGPTLWEFALTPPAQ